jgi:hypothetical protein
MTDSGEFPLWFPFCFVGLWLFVCALLAEISRWPALARRFPGGERPEGTVLRGQVIGIGLVGENNVTYLVPTPTGLYMYAHLLFRFRRPPILVPWSEVQYESTRQFLWMRSHKLSLGGGVTTIRIKHKALDTLQPFLQIPVPVQP